MSNELSDKQRVEMLLEELHLTANGLGIALNYSSSSAIYHILNGVNNLSESFISRVINKYPKVNYNFLKNGTLPVLLGSDKETAQRNILSNGVSFDEIPQILKNIELELRKMNKNLTRDQD